MYKISEKSLINLNVNGEAATVAVRPADTLLSI